MPCTKLLTDFRYENGSFEINSAGDDGPYPVECEEGRVIVWAAATHRYVNASQDQDKPGRVAFGAEPAQSVDVYADGSPTPTHTAYVVSYQLLTAREVEL